MIGELFLLCDFFITQ